MHREKHLQSFEHHERPEHLEQLGQLEGVEHCNKHHDPTERPDSLEHWYEPLGQLHYLGLLQRGGMLGPEHYGTPGPSHLGDQLACK